jgi:hypothetical protein
MVVSHNTKHLDKKSIKLLELIETDQPADTQVNISGTGSLVFYKSR